MGAAFCKGLLVIFLRITNGPFFLNSTNWAPLHQPGWRPATGMEFSAAHRRRPCTAPETHEDASGRFERSSRELETAVGWIEPQSHRSPRGQTSFGTRFSPLRLLRIYQ